MFIFSHRVFPTQSITLKWKNISIPEKTIHTFFFKGWAVADRNWTGKTQHPPWKTSKRWGGATDAIPGGERSEDLQGKNNSPASRRNTSGSREVRTSKSEPAAFLVLFSANSLLQVLRLASSDTGATVCLSWVCFRNIWWGNGIKIRIGPGLAVMQVRISDLWE